LVWYKILESQSFGFSQEVDEVAEDRQTHQEEEEAEAEEEVEITYIGPFAITLFSGLSNVVRVDVEIQESLQRRLYLGITSEKSCSRSENSLLPHFPLTHLSPILFFD
jgi:hypothetical protein